MSGTKIPGLTLSIPSYVTSYIYLPLVSTTGPKKVSMGGGGGLQPRPGSATDDMMIN